MVYQNQFKHIKVEGYYQKEKYISPKSNPRPIPKSRDRIQHGNNINNQLSAIKKQFELLKEVDLPDGIVRDDVIYVEFISDFDFELAYNSLTSDAEKTEYQLLNIREEKIEDRTRFRVSVLLTEGGISHFIKKTTEYIYENLIRNGVDKGKPKNNTLISNIERIKIATLEAFWTEPTSLPFPNEDDIIWWEVWFRKKKGIDHNNEIKRIKSQITAIKGILSKQEINFPEHFVRLVKASAKQLSSSLLLLDNLAELRKPKETADFFTSLNISEKEDAIEELKDRTVNNSNSKSIAICILDSGVQNQHPLLVEFIPQENLYSYKPDAWGTFDSSTKNGHGTGMAGLALYGDLVDAMASFDSIQINHQIESVKIINNSDPNNPELYGAVTLEAVNSPIVNAPNRPRFYCMAITDKDTAIYGRPSSWSAMLDQITFGIKSEKIEKQLFFVSAGNVIIDKPEEFLVKNYYESVHDPAQSFNSISVGAFTEMDIFDQSSYPEAEVLSKKGGMSPANSTSVIWGNQWAVKPDVVMEGGNLLNQNGEIVKPDSLQLLTTHKNFRTSYFQTFGDTSAATALLSNFAVKLSIDYPKFWPETIRALIIHSADWTKNMLGGKELIEVGSFSRDKKRDLLRSYGYGVPNLNKALYSARNSLTLIAENNIVPFVKEESVKFNDIHLFELPWPIDILQDSLGETDVKLNITLSYFIDPNPGRREYCNKFSYQSHGLRFNVIKPDEDIETFKKRVNKNSREDKDKGFTGEDWIIGEHNRNKGSIHRDFWIGSGADLATRNWIAVYPVSGWYRMRTKLEKYNSTVRYSLIVTIESPSVDIDIYTPVSNIISIEV